MSQVTIDLVTIQFSNACHELWTRNNRSQFVGIIFTPSNGSLDWKSHTQLHQSATWSTLTKTELNSWLDRIASMQRCSHTSVDLSFDSILSISILVSTTVPHSNTARCSFIQNQFKQKKYTSGTYTHSCEWIQHKHFLHLSRQIHIEIVCLHLLVLGRLLHKQGKWSVSEIRLMFYGAFFIQTMKQCVWWPNKLPQIMRDPSWSTAKKSIQGNSALKLRFSKEFLVKQKHICVGIGEPLFS